MYSMCCYSAMPAGKPAGIAEEYVKGIPVMERFPFYATQPSSARASHAGAQPQGSVHIVRGELPVTGACSYDTPTVAYGRGVVATSTSHGQLASNYVHAALRLCACVRSTGTARLVA